MTEYQFQMNLWKHNVRSIHGIGTEVIHTYKVQSKNNRSKFNHVDSLGGIQLDCIIWSLVDTH